MASMTKLIFQLGRFGIVGSCAAAVHFSIVIFLVEVMKLGPFKANGIAFLFSFQVSYWGHRRWTFSGTEALHRVALPRLFLVGSTGFFANEGLFYLFYSIAHMPYMLALFCVLSILPLVSFTLGKFWVFR
jgi:putative flippase GtrA